MKNHPAHWILDYDRSFLRFDIIAGLTAAAVVIPKAMAYAIIAGLPVEVGLYAAFIPMGVYAFLGTSRQLSVSTTTLIAILTASQLAMVAPGASSSELIVAASTLAFLVGAILLAASLLRLGFLAYFISAPVLTGFKAGISLIIVVDQIPKLIGVHIDKAGFFRDIVSVIQHLPGAHIPTFALALLTIVLILGLERFAPRLPAPLAALTLGIVASMLLELKGAGVSLVHAVPAGLPAFSWPDLSLVRKLWPGALGIALMSFTESIAAGRAFARQGDTHPEPNRELVSLGAANLVGGFFQSMPAGGGISQTAVNTKAGARTQMAELTTVGIVLVIMLFFSSLIGFLPYATLAAIVIVISFSLIDPVEFRAILRVHKAEFLWAIVTLIGVILLGTFQGILVAVAVSLLTLMYQANHPPVYALGRKRGTDIFRSLEIHPDDEVIPNLLIIRTEGRLTFASMPRTSDKFKVLVDEYSPRVIVLDMRAVPDIEYTALMMLANAEEKLRSQGISLWLAALNPRALETVQRSILGPRLGNERMFVSIDLAVKHYVDTQAKA